MSTCLWGIGAFDELCSHILPGSLVERYVRTQDSGILLHVINLLCVHAGVHHPIHQSQEVWRDPSQ